MKKKLENSTNPLTIAVKTSPFLMDPSTSIEYRGCVTNGAAKMLVSLEREWTGLTSEYKKSAAPAVTKDS